MRTSEHVTLSPSDRAAIEEAAAELRARVPVDRIVLFGSKARGDDDEESDVDLLVITMRPVSRAERHAISDLLFPIQLRYGVVLSVLILSRDEWEAGMVSALPIHEEIIEQGVLL